MPTASCGFQRSQGHLRLKVYHNARKSFCTAALFVWWSRFFVALPSLSYARLPYLGREDLTGDADVCPRCFFALCSCVRYLLNAFEWARLWSHDRIRLLCQQQRGKWPQRGRLARIEHLAVSILLCWVYVRGGSVHSLAPLAKKVTQRRGLPPSVKGLSLPNLFLLCLGGLSCWLYIVFSRSNANTGAALGSFTSLSTC